MNKLNVNQENVMQSMILSGASKEYALKAVEGYKKKSVLTCPYCGGLLKTISLIGNRKAYYCEKDRVCLPYFK